jgi:hypothetical protein
MKRLLINAACLSILLTPFSVAFAQSESAYAHSNDMSSFKRIQSTQITQQAALPVNATPVIRVYKNYNSWGLREETTLSALGKVPGTDWFTHPIADCKAGIPAGTSVVLFTSNAAGDSTSANEQNDPACQQSLRAFVNAGGILVVDMADNYAQGGFMAPGAQGTPDYIFPDSCTNANLSAAAKGPDGILGTADDHPFVKGPDGVAGTADDLTETNIDMDVFACSVAHGNLSSGLTLPANAKILTTAAFSGVERPLTAEYCLGSGRVILDTHTKEFPGHAPAGDGPSFFLTNLLSYAMSPVAKCGFQFTGFKSPVDNPPALNVVKAGSAVPVKFSLNGNQGMTIMAQGSPSSQVVACDTNALSDTVEETVNAGNSSLSYDASTDQYIYVWKTDKAWGGTCRQLNVKLSDGSNHGALFRLNK